MLTRDEAKKLAQDFIVSQGGRSEGLNAQGLGGVMLGRVSLFFEHVQADGVLKVSALVQRFHKELDPALVPAFREEQAAGAETGGGDVDYQPENRGLYLTRVYREPLPPRSFAAELERLGTASLTWLDAVVSRVATRVFHPS